MRRTLRSKFVDHLEVMNLVSEHRIHSRFWFHVGTNVQIISKVM